MSALIYYNIAQPQRKVDEEEGESTKKGEKGPFFAMKMLISFFLGNQFDVPGQPPSSEEEGRQDEGKYGQAIIVRYTSSEEQGEEDRKLTETQELTETQGHCLFAPVITC